MRKYFHIRLNPKRTIILWVFDRGLRWHPYSRGWSVWHDCRVVNLGRLTIDY